MLTQVAIYLAAAVVAVPIFQRLGLGSVLAYLAAGAVIGPWGIGLVGDVETVMHVSELGVVLMLFVIGLELEPSRLWAMRHLVFVLGPLQLAVTAAVVGAAGVAFGLAPGAAILAGLGLALSSTAIAMQLIGEKGETQTGHGRAAFGMLLFQDLAVIPVLALVPLLGAGAGAGGAGIGLLDIAKVAGVLLGLVLAGRFILRPVLRFVADAKNHEVFTAAALLVVIGTALLMNLVGLSMALGAFIAGVLLADSEYRHEIESDIEPFKGLLLGLFFIAVGMSANLGLAVAQPLLVGGLVLALLLVKIAVLLGIARFAKLPSAGARLLAVSMCQGGEFGFVLYGLAAKAGAMDQGLADLLVVVTSVSMAATPLLVLVLDKLVEPRLAARQEQRAFDVIEEHVVNPVIIAGFGRYGQIIARVLNTVQIGYTALELSTAQLDLLKRFGSSVYNKIYYGDASRLDLLRAAKADQAKAFVLAIDDPEDSVRSAEMVKRNFPDLPIYARARNRQHAYKLHDVGVAAMNRETLLASLEMAEHVLRRLGFDEAKARDAVERFREFDEGLLRKQAAVYKDETTLAQTARQAWAELRALLEAERLEQERVRAAASPPSPSPAEPAPELATTATTTTTTTSEE